MKKRREETGGVNGEPVRKVGPTHFRVVSNGQAGGEERLRGKGEVTVKKNKAKKIPSGGGFIKRKKLKGTEIRKP